MDIEFHYWITGMVAKAASFGDKDARIIAYSSQYVDDNTQCVQVREANSDEPFGNEITQTLDVSKGRKELMGIWPTFHFAPGETDAQGNRRRDGMRHVMNTTPDSQGVRDLLAAAFGATEYRPYRIGIASHTFADSWAHQNFVGAASEFNNIPGRPWLNIGHLDAGTDPDTVSTVWHDDRLVGDGRVNNNERFMGAARRLFEEYTGCTGGDGAAWDALKRELERLMSLSSGPRRSYYKNELSWLGDYDPQDWLDRAAAPQATPLAAMLGDLVWNAERPKEETEWYQFQMAAKAHKSLAVNKLRELFRQTGVELLSVFQV